LIPQNRFKLASHDLAVCHTASGNPGTPSHCDGMLDELVPEHPCGTVPLYGILLGAGCSAFWPVELKPQQNYKNRAKMA
jgi:hypothetical protein